LWMITNKMLKTENLFPHIARGKPKMCGGIFPLWENKFGEKSRKG